MIRHSAQKQLPVKSFRHFLPYNPGKSAYPTVLYDKVMSSDEGVLDWLQNIYLFGFSFVKGVPIDPESTKTLLERIAFIRHTHYGGFWDFTADLTFKDTAYTTEFLGAHTDNTYFTDPARLQLFHLLSHTDGDGGASLLVDGFKAASVLKKENPVNYATLVNTFQPYHASGNDGTCIQPAEQAPVFKNHPSFRTLYQIRWNNYDRAAKRDWSTEEQNRWYNAARHFDNIITRKSMQLWTQLEPGTALIFDNWRMLHGRSEFTGKRRMCGGYVNNDDFISRYRLLRFGRDKVLDNLVFTMSTLEDLDDLDREEREKKQDGDGNGRKPSGDGDADMKDAEKKDDEEDLLDEEILNSSTADIVKRRRMLENELRIMKSEYQRLTHEQSTMREKVKDNQEKIENNRQLPYLVGNVVELLDLDVEAEAVEEGANIDLDATRVGKSAVIKTSTRQTIYLPLIGLVDHEKLKPGDLIGVNKDSYLVLDTLPAEYDNRVKAMEVDEKPTEKYTDIGGLDKQIEEIVEAIVWPMKEADRFKKLGIKAPKGALMYGPPGTGKTLLARACAAETNATFLKLAGPQLVQMFIGDGAKLVRDCFALAKEKAPSIIFIDELDAVGTKRFDSEKSGDREVQRTMLELLNQLDGFASDDRIKVLAATNRVDVLDPALLRSGRLDRKIEFPLPNEEARANILQIHSRKMAVDDSINWAELARSTDEFGGAQLKAVCVEAGMIALRKGMSKVGHENYVDAIAEVQAKKKDTNMGIYV
ncbi:P-loop containing nucleoside triphosphate hydrolase protein [Aspergillus alliaceus]|uniref:26S proteasome regulatory subunit 6A n=1 Tax=Petromyces alliaceus TaxID=209559 RepID=A0A5N7C955_PETAA|nr:P-loop containing nucleoside triphosphate hydrolase protein [Aspergillus alliaceus]